MKIILSSSDLFEVLSKALNCKNIELNLTLSEHKTIKLESDVTRQSFNEIN